MDKNAQMLYQYLRDVIYAPEAATLDVDALDADFTDLGKGLLYVGDCLLESQKFAAALAKGNLSCDTPSRENELAAPLKALHASLLHLTWQTQQVAKGDYKQHVDFMGEFAEAFNMMTQQLDERQQALLSTIHEEKRQVQKLETVAYKDPLTGLFNRFYGLKMLEEWVKKRPSFSLCFVDIDNLKYVNDTYGHPEGDRYIGMVAHAIKSFSADAVVCRLGGDEFMILAEGMSFEAADARMAEVRDGILAQQDWKYIRSISYGVVDTDRGNFFSASDLLGIADERMYEFKRAHRGERQRAIDKAENSPAIASVAAQGGLF